MDQLMMEFTLSWGKGTVTGFTSALARPFRKILQDGKDPGTITFVFHQDDSLSYVLGAFAYTDRYIIFYPGFLDRTIVNYKEQKLLKDGKKFHIDHFTLDYGLDTWHIKFDEKSKMPKLRTKKIDGQNYLWMIIRMKSLNSFESTPEKLIMMINASSDEVVRRGKAAVKARDGAIFQQTSLSEEVSEEFFWQFEVFVNIAQTENNPTIPVNASSNAGATITDTKKQNHVRVHQFNLQGFSGSMIIRVSKIIGSLTDPIQFIAGHDA